MGNPVVSGAVSPAERRRARRFPCSFEIAIEWGAAVLHGAVKEVSNTGMFVELEDPLWIGASFAAVAALDQPVVLDCVVRRVEPHRGMGLSFAVSQEAGRAAVTRLLERLAVG
jgi:hypothetical protein